MTTIAVWILATSAAVAIYAYVGYPALLWIAARLRCPRPSEPPGEWPLVSVVLPAYNEERAIPAALDAVLALDYPRDRMEILVVSDASTDRTDAIVQEYADRGVTLLRLRNRSGKTLAENAARAHLKGEIVVNTDASVWLHPDALKPLVAAFSDPTVGVASGRDVSVGRHVIDPNVGESEYVGYEMWVRDLETTVDGIVGASGCFYAFRASLHMETVPAALSRDFAAPLIARENGFRAVSVRDAVCFVPRVSSLHSEYHRKVRTMTRGLETLFYKRHLLNPLRYGVFSWMLFSHKLARWLVPWALAAGGLVIVALARTEPWARWLLVPGGVGAAFGLLAWVWPSSKRIPRIVGVLAYVFLGMVAGLHSWVKALRGDPNPVWEPTRRDAVELGGAGVSRERR